MKFGFIQKRKEYAHSTPVMDEVAKLLQRYGAQVQRIIPEEQLLDLATVTPSVDVYVLRPGVELALSLAGILHSQGAHIVNSYPACALVHDKAQVTHHLLRAGISTPRTFITGCVQQTMKELANAPVVVKPHRGSYGEGVSIYRSFDAAPQSFVKGGYFAQELKESGGYDLKVYVVGDQVQALRRPFPADTYDAKLGQPCAVCATVAHTALQVGGIFDLQVYGIDFIETPDGPFVIDVNYFPGFVGVPGAAQLIADYLYEHAVKNERTIAA